MTERRESSDQLDLFRQPAEESLDAKLERALEDVAEGRVHQMTELKGETWEDAFGDAA